MKFTCPKCQTRLVLPDDKLKPGGMKFRCSRCGATLSYKGKVPRPAGDSTSDTGPLPPLFSAEPEISPSRVSPDHEKPPLQERSPQTVSEAPGPERDKEKEKLKNTKAAVELSTVSAPPALAGSRLSKKAILTAAGAALFVIVLTVVFFHNRETQKPAEVRPSVQKSLPQSGPPVTPAADSPGAGAVSLPFSPAVPSEMTDEKAIEIVKISDALMKRTSVESIVDKWTTENSGKYSIIGWQAKKMDEQSYLVSYTARDGDKTTGFYFNLDIQTGAVQDMAHNKELQTKYNIRYGN
ncbi:MAG: zinc-ribbon domain-containing protein [Nitrospirae bacterium]|nr:zinc-ribbon domain-containing protein [Nitrospirota bacterium]